MILSSEILTGQVTERKEGKGGGREKERERERERGREIASGIIDRKIFSPVKHNFYYSRKYYQLCIKMHGWFSPDVRCLCWFYKVIQS